MELLVLYYISNLQPYPCFILPERPGRVDAGVAAGSGLIRVADMDHLPALKYFLKSEV